MEFKKLRIYNLVKRELMVPVLDWIRLYRCVEYSGQRVYSSIFCCAKYIMKRLNAAQGN